jgi:phosphoribosylanthranilate isomerase
MPVQSKICGISSPEALDAAILGGATHVGFVFFAKSPRDVSPDKAGALAARAAGRAKIVGLFVDPDADFISSVRAHVKLDVIQLHGDERPALVSQISMKNGLETWKAIAIKTADDLNHASKYRGAAHKILYDAKPPRGSALPGGTGLRFDWTLLQNHAHALPWILAGGLDDRNVADAVKTTRASFVDVSSGVEREAGIKDVDKIAAFLKAASLL